ncbi:uncharacterized protein PF3D7_1120000-like [Battus philenor]|uniref:uncharacterized protein PF3D7_1120000-like n=1 Tax=Battus philenor TaxID=42288 RepID=UPI0035CF292D
MEYDVINTTNNDLEIIGSTYADIYLKYDYNKLQSTVFNKISETKTVQNDRVNLQKNEDEDVWQSPSDLLIGIIQLKAPFTSKIIKSKTHKGILGIGDDVLQKEHQEFLDSLKNLLSDNDECWKFLLMNEKEEIQKKLKLKYENIFKAKSTLMSKEIENFYETTLRELEKHIKDEVETVLKSVHANIVSYLNVEIRSKLHKERKKLEEILNKKYVSEVKKINRYYTLLLRNEHERANELINTAINQRNHAVNMFYKQILSERLTSTIYVMCTERKKCKIKKILLEKYHNKELNNIIEKIKERREVLQIFKEKEVSVTDLNKDWEDKIKKVLQLFLKFISFSLKLLPEQTTFLLQLEKMVHLQLDDIKTSERLTSSVLLEEENVFHFDKLDSYDVICNKEPITIEGDFSPTPPKIYGSRETLPSDVDLPVVRLQRQFIYAKCHDFEEIKKFLESQRCKCRIPIETETKMPTPTAEIESLPSSTTNISSNEPLLFDNIQRLLDCPERCCKEISIANSFPYLNDYLDFTEEKFKRVEAILGGPLRKQTKPNIISAKDIAYSDLPFAETKNKFLTVGTQYSSEEDITSERCPCVHNILGKTDNEAIAQFFSEPISTSCIKRNKMLKEITKKFPNILKLFAEHGIDYEINL